MLGEVHPPQARCDAPIIATLFRTVLSAAARFLENIPGFAPHSVAARPCSKLLMKSQRYIYFQDR